MFVMRISHLIGAKLQQRSLFTNAYHSYFIKAIENFFYEFTGVINPRGMLGEREKITSRRRVIYKLLLCYFFFNQNGFSVLLKRNDVDVSSLAATHSVS